MERTKPIKDLSFCDLVAQTLNGNYYDYLVEPDRSIATHLINNGYLVVSKDSQLAYPPKPAPQGAASVSPASGIASASAPKERRPVKLVIDIKSPDELPTALTVKDGRIVHRGCGTEADFSPFEGEIVNVVLHSDQIKLIQRNHQLKRIVHHMREGTLALQEASGLPESPSASSAPSVVHNS